MARTVEQRRNPAGVEHCIAITGKGTPGGTALEEAIEAVTRTAAVLAAAKKKGGNLFRPGAPEVRLRPAGEGDRGSGGFTVLVRVPDFVSARDAREAAHEAAERRPAAKAVRLVAVGAAALRGGGRPGRDRQPSGIRRTRSGPQHRARETLR
ncbi:MULTISPECIES: hypothetical protein [Anaeromyxobacter]|uniref:hypothetical protein n=1 Tax=Anaeromyxobacter TaxID=161492 RepID=UPI001F56199E|nr:MULTISPECIES: hypothetical protein [unclassified Anaeromyxobacter]